MKPEALVHRSLHFDHKESKFALSKSIGSTYNASDAADK
jgi:hypothetical protein